LIKEVELLRRPSWKSTGAKTRTIIQQIAQSLDRNREKYILLSDFHLGLPAGSLPVEREKKVVKWLNSVVTDAKEIYLLGDIFDFWWEYKLVVPRGLQGFLERFLR